MRIIAGKARGRALAGPKNADRIRPTADRVRETIFNVLGQWMDGLEVLDLYAGTGALGLEALSRGAARALLVDVDREALQLCRQNSQALGFEAQVEIWPMPAERALEKAGKAGRGFDLIFADPPYAAKAVAMLLEKVVETGVLRAGGRLCIEHDKQEDAPPQVPGLVRVDQRRFGATMVSWYESP